MFATGEIEIGRLAEIVYVVRLIGADRATASPITDKANQHAPGFRIFTPAAAAAHARIRYRTLTEAGLCVSCARAPADGGVHCGPCRVLARDQHRAYHRANRETRREKNRAHRAAAKAAGRCQNCPEPAEPGRTRCRACAAANAARIAARRRSPHASPRS